MVCLDKELAVGQHLLARAGQVLRTVDLSVEEFRSQGLGAWVLRETKARAAQEGCIYRLRVTRGNPAYRLYCREGFSVIAEDELAWEMEWQP